MLLVGSKKHLEMFVPARSGWMCLLHHLPCTSWKPAFPSKDSIITWQNVSEVIHHLDVTVIFWTWINCLDCMAHFSGEKNPKRWVEPLTQCILRLNQPNEHEGRRAKLNCLWGLHSVSLWPLTFTMPPQAWGSMLAVHPWMREGVNDSWLYGVALSARPAVY